MAYDKRFVRFLEKQVIAVPVLPAVHITNATNFAKIVDSGFIHAKFCKIFKEDLSYFFYGKPAYRISGSRNASTKILGDTAICLLFDLSLLPNIYRNYALDTGAFLEKDMKRFYQGGLRLKTFDYLPR